MGLLQGIKKVTEHKDIYANDEMYQSIDMWNDLYKGYHKEIHDVSYHTIEEGKQTRRMMSLNMPKVVSEEMASLVFNEKCEINISNKKVSKFVEGVLKDNKFNKLFQDYLEFGFALGGMVIKPYEKDGKVKLSFVTADCFIPVSYGNEGVIEAVFVNEWRKGKAKYTHLEWHLWENGIYTIKNEVYKSENGTDDLGVKISLKSVFPKLKEVVPIKNLSKTLFSHFKPNIANNIDTQSPLGISVFGNSLDTLKMIDTMFDSFHREFKLGKKRIAVSANAIKTIVDSQTGEVKRYFDSNDEAYESFPFDEMDTDTVKDIKVELRVDEHESAINAALNLFAMQTGFSPGTFVFDGQSMKTATEVVSEQSKTFKTKKSHETIIESGLQELIHSIVEIGQLYNIYKGTEDFEVTVAFDDSVAEDKTAEMTRLSQELSQNMIPKKRAIMKYYGLSETEAKQWMQEINEENATATAESVNFFGTQGQGSDE